MGQAHALINVFIVGWPVIVALPLAFAIGTAAVNPVGSARPAAIGESRKSPSSIFR